jgi:hypothetical protein
MQKVIIKKLSNKQMFELLFREPTKEEKEILEKMKIEKERREMSVWNNPKFAKKKVICKIKPIFCIEENIGNEYSIKYYKFSGHAMLYKNNKLIDILSTNTKLPSDIINKPWLAYDVNGISYMTFDKSKYKSYYDAIFDHIWVKRTIKGLCRTHFKIIRKGA